MKLFDRIKLAVYDIVFKTEVEDILDEIHDRRSWIESLKKEIEEHELDIKLLQQELKAEVSKIK